MRHNKKLLIATASILSIAAVGTSFALYKEFDETAKTSTITGGIKENGAYTLTQTGDVNTKPLSLDTVGGVKSATYSYKLGYDKAKSPEYKQDSIYGKIVVEVEATGIGSIVNNNTLVLTPSITGYAGQPTWSRGVNKVVGDAITNKKVEDNKITFTMDKIPFHFDGQEVFNLQFSLGEGVNDFDTFKSIAEKQFTYKVTLDEGTQLYAYLKGDHNSWGESANSRMAPNLGTARNDNDENTLPNEWMLLDFTYGTTGTFEARANCNYGSGSDNWSGDGNSTLKRGQKYNFYYNGVDGGTLTAGEIK